MNRWLISQLVLFGIVSGASFAQGAINIYSDRSSFESAVVDLHVIDFEGIAPAGGTAFFNELTIDGTTFSSSSSISVVEPLHDPVYEFGTGAVLVGSYTQEINLLASLPRGVTAVGADFSDTYSPIAKPVYIELSTGDSFTFDSPGYFNELAFFGVVTTAGEEITSLLYAPVNGHDHAMVIDNFSYGKSGVVPEPASVAVWSILCLIGIGVFRRRKRSESQV